MSKSAADNTRRLSTLRWPLAVLVVISAGAVAQASWMRVAGALAGDKAPTQTFAELHSEIPTENPASPVEPLVEPEVEIAPTLPEEEAPPVEVTPEPWAPVPSPSVVATPTSAEPELLLVNPSHNELTVGFALDGEVLWLAPGESRTFPGVGPWSAAYHRGASFGEDRQTLAPGRYEFSVTEQGWSLSAND